MVMLLSWKARAVQCVKSEEKMVKQPLRTVAHKSSLSLYVMCGTVSIGAKPQCSQAFLKTGPVIWSPLRTIACGKQTSYELIPKIRCAR